MIVNQATTPPATGLSEIPAQRRSSDEAHLVVSQGPQAGLGFALRTPLVRIGRAGDNDIALTDSTVSGRHAEIRVAGDRYVLTDVGSFTGTYVNRRPVDQVELRPGDEVRIGRHRLHFQLPGGAL